MNGAEAGLGGPRRQNVREGRYQCVFKRLWLTGFWLVPWLQKLSRQEVVALYDGLVERIAAGALRIKVEATFPMEEIKRAVALSNAYRRAGKVLVTPNGPIG
jgi:NADPH:quinone reductase-like Zn-dependent oxidoreductase